MDDDTAHVPPLCATCLRPRQGARDTQKACGVAYCSPHCATLASSAHRIICASCLAVEGDGESHRMHALYVQESREADLCADGAVAHARNLSESLIDGDTSAEAVSKFAIAVLIADAHTTATTTGDRSVQLTRHAPILYLATVIPLIVASAAHDHAALRSLVRDVYVHWYARAVAVHRALRADPEGVSAHAARVYDELLALVGARVAVAACDEARDSLDDATSVFVRGEAERRGLATQRVSRDTMGLLLCDAVALRAVLDDEAARLRVAQGHMAAVFHRTGGAVHGQRFCDDHTSATVACVAVTARVRKCACASDKIIEATRRLLEQL